jgi:phage terminase large subunit-like protein
MRLQELFKVDNPKNVFRQYPIVDENNICAWPGKFKTSEDIEAEKAKCFNPLAWQREYLLKIVEAEDQVIRREWIKYYDTIPDGKHHDWSATGIDLAISQKETADYTAMVSGHIRNAYSNAEIYILPNPINKRLTNLETIECAKRISDALPHGKLYVEDVGYQASIVEHFIKDGYKAVGVGVHGMDKRSRLMSISHLIQGGRVLVGFGSERHDDLSDAFAILLSQVASESKKSKAFGVKLKPGESKPDALRGGGGYNCVGFRK